MSMASQLEQTYQATSNKEKLQNWDLSCEQPNNSNNTPTYSDIGVDRIMEGSARLSKSDVSDSTKEIKTDRFKTLVYEFFKDKLTCNTFFKNTSKFNRNDEDEDFWKLIYLEIKNRENMAAQLQILENHNLKMSAKHLVEVTESLESSLCMESHRGQDLNSQRESKNLSEKVIEDNDHQNLSSRYELKNHSQGEVVQIGLSAAKENETHEFVIRGEKQIRKAENRTKENADGNNELDIQTGYYPTFSHNREQRGQDTMYSNVNYDCSTILNNVCNDTDQTKNGFGSNDINCLSISWELADDGLTYSVCGSNRAELHLGEDNNELGEDGLTYSVCESYSAKLHLGEENNNCYSPEKNGQNSIGVHPMNDKTGQFFIDRNIVDVDLYQEGLMSKNWNPVQVLYEICSQCKWGWPEFEMVSDFREPGFLFSVKVRGREFKSRKRGFTKKKAKYFASADVLHYLGFKFGFETYQGTCTIALDAEDCHEKINAESVSQNIPENKNFSEELARYWCYRNTICESKQSFSITSEVNSQYNKRKQPSSREQLETQNNDGTDLHIYKNNHSNEFKQSSGQSSSKISKRKCACKCTKIHCHKSKKKSKHKTCHIADLKKIKKHKCKKSSCCVDKLKDISDCCCCCKKKKKSHSQKSEKITKRNNSTSLKQNDFVKSYQNESNGSDKYWSILQPKQNESNRSDKNWSILQPKQNESNESDKYWSILQPKKNESNKSDRYWSILQPKKNESNKSDKCWTILQPKIISNNKVGCIQDPLETENGCCNYDTYNSRQFLKPKPFLSTVPVQPNISKYKIDCRPQRQTCDTANETSDFTSTNNYFGGSSPLTPLSPDQSDT